MAFLTTRVKVPNCGKLKRELKYIEGTKSLVLTLELKRLGLITWYVDASYAVHDDCK